MDLTEHVVGLVYFLEFAVCALVAIGMVLLGQQIELLLYLMQLCVLRHSQDLVVVLAEVYELLLRTISVNALPRQTKSIIHETTMPFIRLLMQLHC